MCGVFAGTGISRSSAAACLAALAHRGPDDEGLREEGSVILGHRRLAIIDPDARSRQPMVSVSGKTRITFNGEIYNYRALREGLVREGARFSTESDTEVLLEGYERHGAAYFDRLRGMWAFVIHDRTRGVLVAARDPFGIKPLYYSTVRGAVAFASELRALARAYPLAPDPRGYPAFYNLGYFIAPDTPFKDTYKLIPGEVCVWDLAERTMTSAHRVPRVVPDAVLGNADLEEALTQSVDAHYVADVPVSILLSGGTDSSLIAALSKKLGRRPTAYHVAVAGSRDTEYATAIAKRLDLPLVVATLDDVALTRQYEKLADILDEPTADVSLIPTSLVFERIKGEAKVVLSGEGGDELFGGYLRHALLARHRKVAKQSFATSALGSLYGTSPAALAYMNPLLGRVTEALLRAGMPDDLAGAYLRSARLADYPLYDREARARLVALYRSDAGAGVPPALAFDLLAYLPNDLLPKSDIASMASSIEARVPFVDRWLLAAALRAHAEGRPPVGDKALLKEVLARYLPADLVYREKGGFGIPLHAYDLPAFAADFDAACRFHLANREAFAVNDQLAALIGEPSLRALIRRKFPRFAFALVTNWRVCE